MALLVLRLNILSILMDFPACMFFPLFSFGNRAIPVNHIRATALTNRDALAEKHKKAASVRLRLRLTKIPAHMLQDFAHPTAGLRKPKIIETEIFGSAIEGSAPNGGRLIVHVAFQL